MLATRLRQFKPCFNRIFKIINPEVKFKSNRYVLQHLSISRRIHGTNYFQGKAQYEYDPSTDSFRPKHQKAVTQHIHQDAGKSNLLKFLKRWSRTVFMITGGIVWGGLIFVALFVDIKDTNDFSFSSHDFDDEIRMLFFYNLAHGKDDLLRIFKMHEQTKGIQSYAYEDLHSSMHVKQEILFRVIQDIQTNEAVIKILGSPVHMCGYRVADKIGNLTQNIHDLAIDLKNMEDVEDKNIKSDVEDKWTIECVLDGSKGLATLNATFYRADEQAEWVLQSCSLQKLENVSSPFIDNQNLVRFM